MDIDTEYNIITNAVKGRDITEPYEIKIGRAIYKIRKAGYHEELELIVKDVMIWTKREYRKEIVTEIDRVRKTTNHPLVKQYFRNLRLFITKEKLKGGIK